MNNNLIKYLKSNSGKHMQIVIETNLNEKRMYIYNKYALMYSKSKEEINIIESDKHNSEKPCVIKDSINNYHIVKLLDMDKITVFSDMEKINILIYKYSFSYV